MVFKDAIFGARLRLFGMMEQLQRVGIWRRLDTRRRWPGETWLNLAKYGINWEWNRTVACIGYINKNVGRMVPNVIFKNSDLEIESGRDGTGMAAFIDWWIFSRRVNVCRFFYFQYWQIVKLNHVWIRDADVDRRHANEAALRLTIGVWTSNEERKREKREKKRANHSAIQIGSMRINELTWIWGQSALILRIFASGWWWMLAFWVVSDGRFDFRWMETFALCVNRTRCWTSSCSVNWNNNVEQWDWTKRMEMIQRRNLSSEMICCGFCWFGRCIRWMRPELAAVAARCRKHSARFEQFERRLFQTSNLLFGGKSQSFLSCRLMCLVSCSETWHL